MEEEAVGVAGQVVLAEVGVFGQPGLDLCDFATVF